MVDVFGHVGLTLATAYSIEQLVRRRADAGREQQAPAASGETPLEVRRLSWLDYRLVIAGSLVPDFIDKPLGLFVAPDLVNGGGRTVAHGVVFAALLIGLSALAFRHGRLPGLLSLAGASTWHLPLDQMWRQPAIMLWPFLGWSFPAGTVDAAEWSSSHFSDLLWFYTDAFELAGAGVVLLFGFRLWRTKAVAPFLRTGAFG